MTGTLAPSNLTAGPGAIRLDGMLYPVAEPIQQGNLARFPPKVVFGDFSKSSDDLISADAQSDFSGGGQIENRHEGSDQGRFWFATLHTRDPNLLCLGRETVTVVGPNTSGATPLGDYAGAFHAAYGTALCAWNETTGTMSGALATLAAMPVALGIEFGGTTGGATLLWIPQGDAGYQTWNGTTLSGPLTTVRPVAFAEWDDRLWAIGSNGVLAQWDGTSAWTVTAQLDKRHTPRHLVPYLDRTDTPALHVVTNRGVFAFDGTSRFYATDLQLPPHPANGLGAAVWGGGGFNTTSGDLYVSAATQTYRYAVGSTNSVIGPARGEGLPAAYRGKIVSLVAEHNGLYALIEGTPTSTAAAVATIEAPVFAGEFRVAATRAYATLMEWTGFGWHTAWVSPGSGGSLTRVFVSGAGGYRLWWGFNGNLCTIALPTDFHNPRQGVTIGVDRFQTSGFLETGWFDAQMTGFDKIGSFLQVNVGRLNSPTCRFDVSYETDYDGTWVHLGTIAATGEQNLSFGDEGLAFQRIRFRYEMATDDPTDTPIIDSTVLHYLPVPHNASNWTLTIQLDREGIVGMFGRDAATMRAEIVGLLTKRGFVQLTIGTTVWRTRLAQAQGPRALGRDDTGSIVLALVEVAERPSNVGAA